MGWSDGSVVGVDVSSGVGNSVEDELRVGSSVGVNVG